MVTCLGKKKKEVVGQNRSAISNDFSTNAGFRDRDCHRGEKQSLTKRLCSKTRSSTSLPRSKILGGTSQVCLFRFQSLGTTCGPQLALGVVSFIGLNDHVGGGSPAGDPDLLRTRMCLSSAT